MNDERFPDLPGLRGWPDDPFGRHFPWMLPALLVGASIALVAFNGPSTTSGALGVVLLIASLIFLVVRAGSVYGGYRRSRGRYKPREQVLYQRVMDHRGGTLLAQDMIRLGQNGDFPRLPRTYDIVMDEGETLMVDSYATYQRYYGTDASWTHMTGFVSSPVLAGAMLLGNVNRRSRAMQLARAQWREMQEVRLLVTSYRLVCRRADGQWLSFYYDRITNVEPNPAANAVVIGFDGPVEPLLLEGPGAMPAAVAIIAYCHGNASLADHPALEPLRR